MSAIFRRFWRGKLESLSLHISSNKKLVHFKLIRLNPLLFENSNQFSNFGLVSTILPYYHLIFLVLEFLGLLMLDKIISTENKPVVQKFA